MSNTLLDRMPGSPVAAIDGRRDEFELEDYRSMRDIAVTVTVELARRLISVEELLRLQVEDVLVFPRPTGENVDLYAADVLFGNAEILGTDEKLAVRIAELLDQPESSLSQPHTKEPAGAVALLETSPHEN